MEYITQSFSHYLIIISFFINNEKWNYVKIVAERLIDIVFQLAFIIYIVTIYIFITNGTNNI